MSKTANHRFYSRLSAEEKMMLISEIWRSMEDADFEADASFVEDIRQSQQQYRKNPKLAVTWAEMAKRLGWEA